MTDQDIITCLANILFVAGADNKLTSQEQEIIEMIRLDLGAEKGHLEQAINKVHEGGYAVSPVGRFSDQVRNLEDMLLIAMCDGELAEEEKVEILAFAKSIQLTQNQVNHILKETQELVQATGITCQACGAPLDEGANFCTTCGTKVS